MNLSSGGVITRLVLDLPDDLNNELHGLGILHTDVISKIETLSNSIDSQGYNKTVSVNFFEMKSMKII